jgi:hypothetical protein
MIVMMVMMPVFMRVMVMMHVTMHMDPPGALLLATVRQLRNQSQELLCVRMVRIRDYIGCYFDSPILKYVNLYLIHFATVLSSVDPYLAIP